ncbi:glycogenin glucosyltransferase [Paramarasmius palmivorus]|uniref:glycogenin glucosyltransferase n=1 Tax=Paramarasmius palmivorus TaxID=297713 RepID=A0AAW0E3M0_9AGAR
MAAPYAFATLVTSDAYLPGALTVAAALRDVHPSPPVPPEVAFTTVCLVTPETVDVSTIKLLRRAFNVVIGVEIITQEDDKNLRLLGRPDLSTVLTKLHVFRLTQYSKIIFLDADVLPIRPLSHLFTLPHEFSAAPDVGWPDIFNSGVMVLSPGEDKFRELQDLLKSRGSWDGGDQGLLNEWRGQNWNRISFTYNTTPTAAYTYAPAYARFGSQISAIHFIGSNKPWKSIAYRAPFQSSSQPEPSQPAYDYNSLVDRWFTIYDKYYRSQDIVSDADFEVRRYVSAWDGQSGTGADLLSDTNLAAAGSSIGLEDLRRIAVEGMSTASVGPSSDNASGEGEYKSLPLDGRFDLMRPQPAPKSPHTPGPDEVPPSPHPHTVPLPHTESSFRPDVSFEKSVGQQRSGENQSHHHQHHTHSHSHLRPHSPPMLLWNPAIEPPPTTAPAPNAFPSDTYFPNIWDQKHQPPHSKQFGSTALNSTTLFEPLPPPQIPEPLQKQGHYSNVIGGAAHVPDPNKVKPIFPWEDKPRQRPGRVFPAGEEPPPTIFASPVIEQPKEVAPEEMQKLPTPQSGALSPVQSVPYSLTFANAWDTVPSIKRYASKLSQPPPAPQPLAAAFDKEDYRKSKNWNDLAEISSRDGDDEDNADDDDESVIRWQDDSDVETEAKSRSRSVSVSTHNSKGKKKEYRVRGVQTLVREMRDQAVQVDLVDPPKVPEPQSPPRSSSRHRKTSLSAQAGSNKKQWSPPTTSALPPVVNSTAELSTTTTAVVPPQRNGSPHTPPGSRSPRGLITEAHGTFRAGLKTSPPSSKKSQGQYSPRSESSLFDSGGRSRQVSNDGSSLASPPSSIGPLSPVEGPPWVMTQRKGGRVWDPARGVELFKRGSEEVLARFLKMSSWEEGSR